MFEIQIQKSEGEGKKPDTNLDDSNDKLTTGIVVKTPLNIKRKRPGFPTDDPTRPPAESPFKPPEFQKRTLKKPQLETITETLKQIQEAVE